MGFGQRLRLAREALKLSGEYVGSQVGVSKATISHWEVERHSPNPGQIKGLCNVLGVTPNWLFEAETVDLPPDAIAEARIYAALSPEDKQKWRTVRRTMFPGLETIR